MEKINNTPPRQKMKLYRGGTPDIMLPLTLQGQALTEDQLDAYRQARWRMQFRAAPNSPKLIGEAVFVEFVQAFHPLTGAAEWGPAFHIQKALADALKPVCYADLFLYAPGTLTREEDAVPVIQFDVQVDGRVTV